MPIDPGRLWSHAPGNMVCIFLDIFFRTMSSTHFECLLQCGNPCESADSVDNMKYDQL